MQGKYPVVSQALHWWYVLTLLFSISEFRICGLLSWSNRTGTQFAIELPCTLYCYLGKEELKYICNCTGQITVTTAQKYYKIRIKYLALHVICKSIKSPYLNFSYLEITHAKWPLKLSIIRSHGFESFWMTENTVWFCVCVSFSVVSPDGFK